MSSLRVSSLAAMILLPAGLQGQVVAGWYEFWVLDSEAPTADTAAAGSFVLFDGPVPTDDLPSDLLAEAERESRWLIRSRRIAPPNACFGFRTSVTAVGGREFYAGITEAGLTTWTEIGDSVEVHLYQSPDASLHLKGVVRDGVISGRVHQGDYDRRGPVEWLPFRANRAGDPSSAECIRAIEMGRRLVRR